MDRGVSACASCGAPVVWAVTMNDKAMPVDPDPVENGNLILEPTAAGTRAAFVARPPELADDPNGDRWVSHFATCPQSKTWRKPK